MDGSRIITAGPNSVSIQSYEQAVHVCFVSLAEDSRFHL